MTGRVSGDFYQSNRLNLPGEAPRVWRVYRESWVVDTPQVVWSDSRVVISGTVRYWKGTFPATTVKIEVAWGSGRAMGPAAVIFEAEGADRRLFTCDRTSNSFRELSLEVAVCESVNTPPILPQYHVASHPNRPSDLTPRGMGFEAAYAEAGIQVTIRPDRRIVDDSAPEFVSWTSAELHDALETYYSRANAGGPQWDMWGILATRFETPSVGGIMFDTSAESGGAGQGPERQGFAIFRSHLWFDNLKNAPPTNAAEAEAARQFLYTWVHEAGHAFNFLHSWDKNRPDALSWMNYDWRYDNRNGAGKFWSRFRFRFDDEELIHLRHGDRSAVIMGGDPWGSEGNMLTSPAAACHQFAPGAMVQAEGDMPLEVLLKSKAYFDFLEPVQIELRLRNLLSGYPLAIDTNLDPDYGAISVFIRRPDGRVVQFSPVTCKLAPPAIKKLKYGAEDDGKGFDRHSVLLSLAYGSSGFYFDHPGQYLVRVTYQGPGDLLCPSNILHIRIGTPIDRDHDRLAQDFLRPEVGLNLAFDGSGSPRLKKGLDVLRETAHRYEDEMLGAKAASVVANAAARPFFQVVQNDAGTWAMGRART